MYINKCKKKKIFILIFKAIIKFVYFKIKKNKNSLKQTLVANVNLSY